MQVNPKDIIFRLKANNDHIRQTARDLDVSPGTVLHWKRRASTASTNKHWRYSTRPHTVRATSLSAEQTGTVLEERIVASKREERLQPNNDTGSTARMD